MVTLSSNVYHSKVHTNIKERFKDVQKMGGFVRTAVSSAIGDFMLCSDFRDKISFQTDKGLHVSAEHSRI